MILNFVAFQAGWFACVLGAAAGRDLIGPGIAGLVLALHLWRAPVPGREFVLLLCAFAVGLALETVLVAAGWNIHRPLSIAVTGVPLWMLALWPLFATTLNVTMRWLRSRDFLAAAFGAIGGPLAYWAGARLGALDLAPGVLPLVAIGFGWAVAMPLLMRASIRFDGFQPGVVHSREVRDVHA